VSSTADRIAAAIEARDVEAVDELLAADPAAADTSDGQGRSLVLLALFHGLRGAVTAILERRNAPLDGLEAAAVGRTDRLRELLAADREAVLAARTWEGFDAIGLAAFLGGADCVVALLEHGADPDGDPANPFGVRPVHAAAAHRDAAAMRALLEAGADPGATQRGGLTPLHTAAHHDDVEIAELLLAHGADPAPCAEDGRTPADLAAHDGGGRVAALLAARVR
jgi:ankyrin repeat protein